VVYSRYRRSAGMVSADVPGPTAACGHTLPAARALSSADA